MLLKFSLRISLLIGLFCLSASVALAGDLQVTVNQWDHTMTIFNSTPCKVQILGFNARGGYIEVNCDVEPFQEVIVPYESDVLPSIRSARCLGASPAGIHKRSRGADGFYYLSVDLVQDRVGLPTASE